MSLKTVKATVDSSHSGTRLDIFLTQRFGQELDLSRRQIRARIEDGSVYVNGRRTQRLSREVQTGETIELRLGATFKDSGWALTREHVIYEDDDIIAVNKPPGLPSQATLDTSRHNLHRAVELYLRETQREPYAGLHQRLDRDTSGVIALTKSRRANKGMADQISQHLVRKVYFAIARKSNSPIPREPWTVTNHLLKGEGRPAKMLAVHSGGDLAETTFTPIEELSNAWLVQAEPRTGRMHQIRVHLADQGLPILGDGLYGGKELASLAPRLMLHARELHIQHPVTGQALKLEAPLPHDMLATLEKLRKK